MVKQSFLRFFRSKSSRMFCSVPILDLVDDSSGASVCCRSKGAAGSFSNYRLFFALTPPTLTCSIRDRAFTVSGSLHEKQAMCHHNYGDATHGRHERYTTLAQGNPACWVFNINSEQDNCTFSDAALQPCNQGVWTFSSKHQIYAQTSNVHF